MSKRQPGGDWEEAQNLGPMINTPLDEDTPFLTDNNNRLYFSSQGHFNMGGFDIYYSELRDDGQWTEPINAGYPLNTTSDDLFYYPIDNGNQGYQARVSRDGPLTYDLYYVNISEQLAKLSDDSFTDRFSKDFYIQVVDTATSDTMILFYNRDKDLFISDDRQVQVSIKEKQ